MCHGHEVPVGIKQSVTVEAESNPLPPIDGCPCDKCVQRDDCAKRCEAWRRWFYGGCWL